MIEFEHKLPSMNIDGKHNGTYNNEEMGCPCILTTKDAFLGQFIHKLRNIICDERRLVFIGGKALACSNNWIRDHVHQMIAFYHWEYDLKSFLSFIIETQNEKGYFYELIKQYDDYHWKFVDKDHYVMYDDDNVALVRLELEADIEYLVVMGTKLYYKATGDLDFVRKVLPKLEKGIDYITSDEKRFDKEHGLVKRLFTIDTWDFAYGKRTDDRTIKPGDGMSVMHGDNSGVYAAMRILAEFEKILGDRKKADEYENRAQVIKENMKKYLWNGSFFVHQLHLDHDGADDLENVRLSLSNTYDINRGVATPEMAESIILEYLSRKEKTASFAEWFSIDPPYSFFAGNHKPGTYVNGAISPFTAGELAKAAFSYGFEEYGYDIIKRISKMVERDGNLYFLYSPKDSLPQGGGPSGWGAACVLSAIDEGLAGICDTSCLYRTIFFSPRFPVTEYTELRYITGYEVSGKFVDVRYILKENGMRYDIKSPASEIACHILLPKGKSAKEIYADGRKISFEKKTVRNSLYADFLLCPQNSCASIEILFE